MRLFSNCSRFGVVGVVALGLGLVACGKKGSTATTDPTAATKAEGEKIALSGQLALGSSASLTDGEFNLLEAASGTIKCTYAAETEDTAKVTDGKFDLACKSGKPMVISFFDADGNPTCTIKFKVQAKELATASISQDVKFGELKCADGEATADLDVLAPASAKAQSFEKDASVNVISGENDHWKFTVSAVAEIGRDGGKKKSKKSESKSRSKASLALAGEKDNKDGGDKHGKAGEVINLAFYDTSEEGAALGAGKVRVGHEGEEGWEFIDNADILWSGKSFTISLKEEKNIKDEFAQMEIERQRGGSGNHNGPDASSFKQSCDQNGCQPGAAPSPGSPQQMPSQQMPPMLALEEMQPAPRQAPDQVNSTQWLPLEDFCANTKWNSYLTAKADNPCAKFANFEFVDFGMVCKSLPDSADGVAAIAKMNVMQCRGGFGGAPPMGSPPPPVFSDDRKNNPQCQGEDAFKGHNPLENFVQHVDQIQSQMTELKEMIKLADAGDAELAKIKPELQKTYDAISGKVTELLKAFKAMESVGAEIESKRSAYCAGTSNEGNFGDLFQKINPGKLQPYFEGIRKLFDEKIYRNPKVSEARRKYMVPPFRGFDGSACTFPAGATKFLSHKDLAPSGDCKIVSNIVLSGSFKDNKSIKPFTLTFMDKPSGDCSLKIKKIKFDELTGCWVYGDDLKPVMEEEAMNLEGVFNQGLQRVKMMGEAIREDDE